MLNGLFVSARAAFSAGFPKAATAALREVVWREQRNGEAHFLLCTFLLRQGDPEAGQLLQRCLDRFPEPSPGWVEIGEALLEKNKKEAGLLCLAKGLPDAQLALRCGLLARELGRSGEALSWFKQTVQLDPLSERGWFLLGTCAQDSCDFDLATQAYRNVLQLNPTRIEAEVNLGMSLQQAGSLEEAKQCYARAVHARPDTFSRIAQALPGAPKGELWLDLGALRRSLAG